MADTNETMGKDSYRLRRTGQWTRSTTTTATLELLQETFARYGNPHTLVSDNGTQFGSASFKLFCDENGIQHLTTAPYHPQSNGQAERFVDTLKRGLKKLAEGEKTVTFQHLQTFLSVYRSTPNRNAPDGKSPAHLFLGREMRTSLDLLKPSSPRPTLVNEKQNDQFNQRHGAVKRAFNPDDLVYAQHILADGIRTHSGWEIVNSDGHSLAIHVYRDLKCFVRTNNRSLPIVVQLVT
ncbi:uncharacterized protein K02A2.6-like [Aedes albopictus]|uniref:Integrase catalytic domain-containing protein n=1 Tax=Aedes albopictus TaxID=7160 RepID=A0ABM1XJN8_AEDAL